MGMDEAEAQILKCSHLKKNKQTQHMELILIKNPINWGLLLKGNNK